MFDIAMFFVGLGCGAICAYGFLSDKIDNLNKENEVSYRNGFTEGKSYAETLHDRKKCDEIYEIQKYRDKLKEEFDDINELTEKWLKVKEGKEPTYVEDREH